MSMNLNTYPYYDDFDPSKNYHKILFKPTMAVQARELTQIQSILQEQIKSMGDFMFKNGSMVIPGNVSHDLSLRAVSVTLETASFDINNIIGLTIQGETNKVKLYVVHAEKTGTAATLYVKTTANSSVDPTISMVLAGEALGYLVTPADTVSTVFASVVDTDPVSDASLGFVNDGIYYVNGNFVKVYKQTVVLSSTSKTPTVQVGLVLLEEIVTHEEDNTLLDNASGFSNQNAPGADRYKLTLKLVKYEPNDVKDPTFIPLFALEDGVLVQLVSDSTYNQIMQVMARRTYEESGNYISNQFEFLLHENIPEDDNLTLRAFGGVAFIGGYEVNTINNRLSVTVPKARTYSSMNNQLLMVEMSGYITAYDTFAIPKLWSVLELRDDTITSVGTPVGNIVGFASVYAVEKHPTVSGAYRLYLYDLNFASGKTWDDVSSYREVGLGQTSSGNLLKEFTLNSMTGEFNSTDYIVDAANPNMSGLAVYSSSGFLLLKKRPGTAYKWHDVKRTIKQENTGISAFIDTKKIIDTTRPPVFGVKFPKSEIRSATDYIYHVQRTVSVTISGGVGSVALGLDENVTYADRAIAWVSNSADASKIGQFVDVSLIEGSATVNVSGLGAYENDTISILVTVRKGTAAAKAKTLTNGSYTFNGLKTTVQLPHQNIYEIKSVVQDGEVVSNRYSLVVTNTSQIMQNPRVELVSGFVPVDKDVTINYTYLEDGVGDFAVANSYTSLGAGDSYISKIPSAFNGVRLNNVIDYRVKRANKCFYTTVSQVAGNTVITLPEPISAMLDVGMTVYGQGIAATITEINPDNSIEFTVDVAPTETLTENLVIIGINSTSWTTTNLISEPLAPSTSFTCDYQYYLPYFASIALNSKGELVIYKGTPSERPTVPTFIENESQMKIAELVIPSYTFLPANVSICTYSRRNWTMDAITGLERRVANVEETVTLNTLETGILNKPIIDPVTGLDRFKSGFASDPFDSYSLAGTEDSFMAKIDPAQKSLLPLSDSEALSCILIKSESSNFVIKGNRVFPYYTEETIIDQSAASNTQNINPFAVFKWVGSVTLTPTSDFWTDTKRLADIQKTIQIG